MSRICRFGEECDIEEQLKKLLRMRDAGSKLAEQKLEQAKLRQDCMGDESKEEGREEVFKTISKVYS